MSDFEDYADSYEQKIASAVPFVGRDAEFFVAMKAELLIDLVRRRLGDPARARVLDVGCGPGGMDSYLLGHVGALHGVDTSKSMVARATKRNPEAAYVVCEPHRLPFDGKTFDLAFASCVLHHVDGADRKAFATELHRVVRPGGIVAVFEHNPFNPLTRAAVNRCAFDEGVELIAMGTMKRLLGGVRLSLVDARYIVFFPWRQSLFRRIEGRIGFLPLGAQYLLAARRR